MIKIFEAFAGYGTATFALKQLGVKHDLVGYSEIDKYAIQCFQQNHCDTGCTTDEGIKILEPNNFGDITKIDWSEVPDFDLLTGGFPCQSFSVAGKGLGEQDDRGVLANYLTKALIVKQPKYFLFENVKGFMSKKHSEFRERLFKDWKETGYVLFHKVLNTRDFGIPQNRERVFIIGFRKDVAPEFGCFSFPEPFELKLKLKDVLEDNVDGKYFLKEEQVEKIMAKVPIRSYKDRLQKEVSGCLCSRDFKSPKCIELNSKKDREFGRKQQLELNGGEFANSISNVQKALADGRPVPGGSGHLSKEDGTTYCLDTGNCQAIEITAEYRHPFPNCKPNINFSPAIKGSQGSGNQTIINKVRRLTPKECFRLQGFLGDEVNLDFLSDTQRYKLAGNGQSVNVVKLLFKELLNKGK